MNQLTTCRSSPFPPRWLPGRRASHFLFGYISYRSLFTFPSVGLTSFICRALLSHPLCPRSRVGLLDCWLCLNVFTGLSVRCCEEPRACLASTMFQWKLTVVALIIHLAVGVSFPRVCLEIKLRKQNLIRRNPLFLTSSLPTVPQTSLLPFSLKY